MSESAGDVEHDSAHRVCRNTRLTGVSLYIKLFKALRHILDVHELAHLLQIKYCRKHTVNFLMTELVKSISAMRITIRKLRDIFNMIGSFAYFLHFLIYVSIKCFRTFLKQII